MSDERVSHDAAAAACIYEKVGTLFGTHTFYHDGFKIVPSIYSIAGVGGVRVGVLGRYTGRAYWVVPWEFKGQEAEAMRF